MDYISCKISGTPYCSKKTRGKTDEPNKWTQNIIEQTQSLPKVKEACEMRVTFLLPPDKFPKDYPFGPDLDNLLKRFFDALNKTIFCEAKGNDSCVVSLHVRKTEVKLGVTGVQFEIFPIKQ